MKSRTGILALLITCFTLYSCKSDDLSEEVPQIFNLSGKVTKSDGGVAPDASVMLVKIADGNNAGESPTNAAGEYIITGVSAGNYKLIVTLTGYETGSIDEIKVANSDITLPEIVLQKITIPTYAISGTISKSDGSAAAGATVQVRKASDNTYVGQAVTTDAAGVYSIGNIPPDKYNIIITLDGYEPGILSDVTIDKADLVAFNLTLQPVIKNENAINIVFSDNDATIENLPSNGSVTASKKGADVTIATSSTTFIEYVVSGATSNGSLKIQNNADIPNTLRLTLNNAIIVSSSKLPPIQITKNEGATIVELKGNNILSDNASNEENATLISKSGSLEFDGYGKLNVSGTAKHAIASGKKSITVRDGDITVTSAASDGFHAEVGFEMSGGSLNITASSDGIDAGSGTAVINGGNVRINSFADDVKGIKADAGITINSGTIDMTVSGAQSKGVSSKSDIVINGGNISVETSGTAVLEPVGSGYDPSYCTAIKSNANITVNGGNIKIESKKTADGGKGISADGDIEIKGGTINITTAGDGKVYTTETGAKDSYTAACIKSNQNVSLLGGNIICSSSGTGGKGVNVDGTLTIGRAGTNNADLVLTVKTSGERFLVSGSSGGGQGGRPGGPNNNDIDYANPKAVKCLGNLTVNSGTISINCTQKADGGEGLESKSVLTINGGNIDIRTYDDCINATTSIVINGGNIFCAASGNDAIDSNGSMTINGGFVIANGVKGDGEAFDADSPNKVQINGGIIIGTSGSTMSSFAGSQRYYKLQGAAGSAVGIKKQSGEYILLFTIPVITGASTGTNLVVIFSDPRLVSGSHTLLTGGSISGGTTVNGYNTGGTYTGGTSKSFSL